MAIKKPTQEEQEQQTNFSMDDLKKLSVDKLKSMAYDTLAIIEMQQKNLSVLNQLIAEKTKQ